MTGHEIRQRFLDYYARQQHTIVPSASLVPADDPTLLFTGAGMNQFKDYFLGRRKDLTRAASCQTCFRTPDLEQVGKTASHLTFFEMLGNFSFGEYFKREAITWAWEFMTREMRLPGERLWATVYEQDDEALGIWRDIVRIPAARIVRMGATDNFWPSNAPTDGPNGPCGPCSEIHYDYGSCVVGQRCPDPDRCRPGCSCGRFVEVWNLVFMQYDRRPDGSLAPLPAKNIDTGMGLERLTAVVNGLRTNFDTDLLKPIVNEVHREVGASGLGATLLDTTQRPDVYAIVDHVRALTFLIHDGVVPSNDGRGYVARMLLRKAARHGRALGLMRPFLHRVVPAVVTTMAPGYPELTAQRERIAKVILIEEERYQQTLDEKQPILDAELRKGLTPDRAAWLYDTHGLPYEEIVAAAQPLHAAVPDRTAFDRALAVFQAKSKASAAFDGAIFAETFSGTIAQLGVATRFVGYAALEAQGKIVALLQDGRPVDQVKAPTTVMVVLDQTPFYGESGGQLGDTGTLHASGGTLAVEDTKRVDHTIVHLARLTDGVVRVHDTVRAAADPARRQRVARNHTATHLLHAALRTVLGAHVQQAGSLVAPDRLRFDFTHTAAVPALRLADIETLANEWVRGNHAVAAEEMPIAAAKAAGALAFFGEKYGDRVRVITINGFSKEFCGGTHLAATGSVGVLAIVDEGSVASGVRRVEALTGEQALAHLKGAEGQLVELAQALKSPREQLGDAVERLRGQVRTLQQELERFQVAQSRTEAQQWVAEATAVGDIQLLCKEIPGVDMAKLRSLYDAWKLQAPANGVLCLGSAASEAVYLVAGASAALVQRGLTARAIIDRLAPMIGGKGGGRPEFAQAGGRHPDKLREALAQVPAVVRELVKPS